MSEAIANGDALARFSRALTELTSRRLLGGGPVEPRVRGFTEVVAGTLGVPRVSLWRKDVGRGRLECVDLFDARTGRHESGQSVVESAYPDYFRALDDERNIAAADALADARTRELGP